VQVGYYLEQLNGDVGFPNCKAKETVAHMCVCLDEDRTRLLKENTNELEFWMTKYAKKDPEIGYWVPKYIKFRGARAFADMGMMSPQITALTKSQDKIGRKNFVEEKILTIFLLDAVLTLIVRNQRRCTSTIQ
jgi:hypothetical protein